MAELGIVKEFKASHGQKPHDHFFKVEVTFEGKMKNDMVSGLDFHVVKTAVEELIGDLEGRHLEDIMGRATVENIAIHFIKKLGPTFPVKRVKVWEEADRYISVSAIEMAA